MKNIFITIAFLLSFQSYAQEKATISKNQQTIIWTGKAATGGYTPEGTLEILSAEILITNDEVSKLFIVVDMKSLYHENKQLKSHLRDKDFFDVKKYPVATFTLKEVSKIENGKAKFIGNMTIKGVTHEETVEAQITNESQIILNIHHKIDRTKYGVNFNSPSVFTSMKENLIADVFTLKGNFIFTY